MADGHPLTGLVTTANNTLGRIEDKLEHIDGKLEIVANTLEAGFEQLDESIQRQTEAQAELKLMEHMAEVTSIKPQIEAEREQIDEERRELEDTLDSIRERYQRKHDELDETAERRVRDLGEHIFRIDEAEFEDGVEDPFVEHVTGTWQKLREHNEQAGAERESRLEAALSAATEAIEGFVDRRQRLLSRIDDHRTDVMRGVDAPESVEVPFYVVRVERDGVSEEVLVTPSRMVAREDSWFAADLDPLPGFEEPMATVARGAPAGSRNVGLNPSRLAETAGEFGRDGLAGQVSFADAFEATLDERLTLAVEEGGKR